jgi:hypothetical protein
VRDELLDEDIQPRRVAQQPYGVLRDALEREHLEGAIARAQAVEPEEYLDMIRTLPEEWIIEPNAPKRLASALRERAAVLTELL